MKSIIEILAEEHNMPIERALHETFRAYDIIEAQAIFEKQLSQQPPVAVAWPSEEERNKLIRSKLLHRGFSENTLLNNRGLIGAVIEDTMSQSTAIDMEVFLPWYDSQTMIIDSEQPYKEIIAKYYDYLKQKKINNYD